MAYAYTAPRLTAACSSPAHSELPQSGAVPADSIWVSRLSTHEGTTHREGAKDAREGMAHGGEVADLPRRLGCPTRRNGGAPGAMLLRPGRHRWQGTTLVPRKGGGLELLSPPAGALPPIARNSPAAGLSARSGAPAGARAGPCQLPFPRPGRFRRFPGPPLAPGCAPPFPTRAWGCG